jgi:hypothetical protein
MARDFEHAPDVAEAKRIVRIDQDALHAGILRQLLSPTRERSVVTGVLDAAGNLAAVLANALHVSICIEVAFCTALGDGDVFKLFMGKISHKISLSSDRATSDQGMELVHNKLINKI